MGYSWCDALGNLGVLLIVGTYLLLQVGKVRSDSLVFSLANASGATFVLISLYYNFNLSAFIIEFFWLLISLYGLWNLKQKKLC
ncbi:hypothetical protein [Dasania marina]|uniref:CBU_0592 family membrane protein n=1 Tax=Dasania marina TaxID=471499 RepID=UPI0030D90AD6